MIRPKAKTTPLRADAGSSPGAPGSRRRPWGWRLAGHLLIWSILVAALVWSVKQLDTYVRATRPTPECRLDWVELPIWLTARTSEQILRDITTTAGLRAEDDLRDPELAQRIGESLLRSPWVADVKRISKHPTGLIRITAVFREPFAFVELNGYAYLVDATGVRLPNKYVVTYVEERFWNDWLRIVGVSAAIPEEGELWAGDDLAAGLRLVQYLKQAGARGETPFRPSLRAIDVANFHRRESDYDAELRIRTVHPRSYIAWGLPPGEEFEVEAGANRKLELLRSYYSEHGGQFPEGWVYDVRGADGIRRWPYKDKGR